MLFVVAIVVLVVLTFGLAGTGLLLRPRAPTVPADPDADLPDVRDRRIAELEARLAQPAKLGVTPFVAAVVLGVCGVMLWMQWPDTRFFFSSKDPIQLGAEGDYRFEAASDNRYVELHGVPTSRGAFGVDGKETVVAVGVRDTPVMVWRKALRGEEWKPGTKPPPPNQQPFTVRGRLLARETAPEKFTDAFAKLDGFAEINARWVLLESARPGGDFAAAVWTTVLMALAGFNAWLLVRGLAALRFRRP